MSAAEVSSTNTALIRALDDLHEEFVKASKQHDREHAGSWQTAIERRKLIETYAIATARIGSGFTPMVTLGDWSAPATTVEML